MEDIPPTAQSIENLDYISQSVDSEARLAAIKHMLSDIRGDSNPMTLEVVISAQIGIVDEPNLIAPLTGEQQDNIQNSPLYLRSGPRLRVQRSDYG